MSKSITFVFFALLSVGCVQQPTLYQQLGNENGLSSIVDNLLFNIAENDKILHHFEHVDIDRFRENFILHLCEVSNGPCQYRGDSVREVHAGMNVLAGDFDSLVEDLIAAMEEAKVSFRAQNELIRRLATFRDDIVAVPSENRS